MFQKKKQFKYSSDRNIILEYIILLYYYVGTLYLCIMLRNKQ